MTKRLELSQGKFAIVGNADYEWANQWKWSAERRKNTFYAQRTQGKWPFQKKKYLHREIMQAPPGVKIDHIDGNGLNCVRSNMRLATHAQNMRNSRLPSNSTSGYKGVSWHKQRGKWQARIGVNGKKIFLGYFTDKKEAARAYDAAARKHHGRFAKTNFSQ